MSSSHRAIDANEMLADTLQSDERDPRIGQVIHGRYRILHTLGEGGMGTVYEAEHVLTQRRVAIKFLHALLARSAIAAKRFLNEARAATTIDHPNVVEVLDMAQLEDGTAFMVLPLLRGRDLGAFLHAEGPLSVGATVRILTQVCDALSAAHAKGIIHRDLKPANIFLVEREGAPDQVKLLDFGIAKFRDQGDNSLTRTGQTLGTPYFMSPEQAHGKRDVDHRSDLYSLGVILFYCLAGALPFHEESLPLLIVKICNDEPPSVGSYRRDVPAALAAIVHRLLAKDRDDRFSSASEVKTALLEFGALDTVPEVSVVLPQSSSHVTVEQPASEGARTESLPPPRTDSSKLSMIVALAALAIATTLGAVLFFRDPSPPPAPAVVPTVSPPAPGGEHAVPAAITHEQPALTPASTTLDAGAPPANATEQPRTRRTSRPRAQEGTTAPPSATTESTPAPPQPSAERNEPQEINRGLGSRLLQKQPAPKKAERKA